MKISREDLDKDVEAYLKKGGKIHQVQAGQTIEKFKDVKATDRDIRNIALITFTRKSFSGDRIKFAENKNRIIR